MSLVVTERGVRSSQLPGELSVLFFETGSCTGQASLE